MKSKKILVVGSLPPPIGGVTIHIQRLLFKLHNQNEIKYEFIDLRKVGYFEFLKTLFKGKIFHIHTSSPYLRFIVSLFSFFFLKKVFITYHGDVGRFKSKIKNLADIYSIKLSSYPIVLNQKSFNIAREHNKRTQLITSFIGPDISKESLEDVYSNKIKEMKRQFNVIFSTNAYNISYDKNGVEIYGIYEIIECFKSFSNYGLVISDPSGSYLKKIKDDKIIIPDNILIINKPHSFYKVVSLSDVTIRNTSTDGDSLSIRESLFLGKITLCTDVVSRPTGCFLYERGKLNSIITNVSDLMNKEKIGLVIEQATDKLFKLYSDI